LLDIGHENSCGTIRLFSCTLFNRIHVRLTVGQIHAKGATLADRPLVYA
jgi:hypothetical protein